MKNKIFIFFIFILFPTLILSDPLRLKNSFDRLENTTDLYLKINNSIVSEILKTGRLSSSTARILLKKIEDVYPSFSKENEIISLSESKKMIDENNNKNKSKNTYEESLVFRYLNHFFHKEKNKNEIKKYYYYEDVPEEYKKEIENYIFVAMVRHNKDIRKINFSRNTILKILDRIFYDLPALKNFMHI